MSKSEDLISRLEKHRFRFDPSPSKPVTLIGFKGLPICTAGNISNVQGPAKSAKSVVLCAMMAATVKALCGIKAAEGEDQGSPLHFSSNLLPDANSVILHFDTEQSAYDHHQQVRKALGRMGTDPATISNLPLQSYSLVEFDIGERKQAIELIMNSLLAEGKKFPCLFLDGVADIVSDPNDFKESGELVAWLHRLAGQHQFAVVTVLHENPGATESGSGKTRGHLGSQIERKSETNLRVAKDRIKVQSGYETLEISTIWVDRARHCHIPKKEGVKIAYNYHTKRHEIAAGSEDATQQKQPKKKAQGIAVDPETVKTANVDEKRREVEEFLKKTFAANKSDQLSSAALVSFIEVRFHCKERTAIKHLNEWRSNGWIYKGLSARSPYSLTPPEDPGQKPAPNGNHPVAVGGNNDSPASEPPIADPPGEEAATADSSTGKSSSKKAKGRKPHATKKDS